VSDWQGNSQHRQLYRNYVPNLTLTAGIASTHVLECPNKLLLEAEDYLFVQQHLYEGFGKLAGPFEGIAIVALMVATLFLIKRQRLILILSILSLLTAIGGLTLFFFVNDPVNPAVDSWTLETIPEDWQTFRDAWERSHATRAGLYIFSLAAFGVATLMRAQYKNDTRSV
jgi:hypothetical protein